MPPKDGRLVVVSNRIPTGATPSGGLVVALHEALSARGGVWIGSSGAPREVPASGLYEVGQGPYRRLAFDLSMEEHETYYLGYANSVLWPLFHRRADLIDLQPGYAEGYLAVNARLADAIVAELRPADVLWVHDYHFLPLAALLRARGVKNRIGFFLHIPFPAASDVPALPQADDLLDWVAAHDVFGVQTEADVQRVDALVTRVEGDQQRVMAFPIGIDVDVYREAAGRPQVGAQIHRAPDQKICLGVDRLDYSKGLVHRFEGFSAYLDQRRSTDPRAIMVQVAPPSRGDVGAYQDIRDELEMMAGRVNGRHANFDWTPIRYLHRMVPRDDLAGVMRLADVGLVTPLADGMNLVAKEYIAAQDPDDPGVLILSHFAGAAEQMQEAVLVNPYDSIEMGEAIAQALSMPLEERRARYAALLQTVARQDIHWWTQACLAALEDGAGAVAGAV
ncbi:MAG: trehalose-6-phosphate synthase [Pseudomonadota bacterium]